MLREFFNDHIRFKRNIDKDIENLWDLMICGHAKSAHPVSGKVKFLYFVINIVGIALAFLGMGIIGVENKNGGLLISICIPHIDGYEAME